MVILVKQYLEIADQLLSKCDIKCIMHRKQKTAPVAKLVDACVTVINTYDKLSRRSIGSNPSRGTKFRRVDRAVMCLFAKQSPPKGDRGSIPLLSAKMLQSS